MGGWNLKKFHIKYGRKTIDFEIPKDNLLGVIESNIELKQTTEENIILNALKNPIGSSELKNIVRSGEKICIVISDITRAWQKMSIFLPYIVDELSSAGIADKDITFLCATGSHRKQTIEEHNILLGEKLSKRFEIIDHDCRDKDSLVHIGNTNFGTPVSINKIAVESDHVILTGAIAFHDLVGWSGGKKSILPGIAGHSSIMANHSLSLSPNIGEGVHPRVCSGNIRNNPIHEDMLEAAGLLKPSFLFNVIIGPNGKICNAVAGDYIKAHDIGRSMVEDINGIYINKRADLVIASAGGFPKDIDFYQGTKALINAKEAVKEGGSIILLAQCPEGVGHKEMEDIISSYSNNEEREKFVRQHYTISRFIGYLTAEISKKYNVVLISDVDSNLLNRINIESATDISEALELVYGKKGKELKTYIIEKASDILPRIKE